MLTVPIPIAIAGFVALEETLDRDRSWTVEETERPSRGGKMLSSEDSSSSTSGRDPWPLMGSTDDGWNVLNKPELESGAVDLLEVWPVAFEVR